MLLLHGLADTHELWRHVAPELARGYRVLALDTRGHGASESGGTEWTMQTLIDDVLTVADAAGADRFAMVGLSMGGGIAQGVALAAPERVWLLGLVSTSAVFSQTTRARFLERAAAAEREGMAPVTEASVARWFTPDFAAAHPDVIEWTRDTVRRNDRAVFARASWVNATRDWSARLGEIHCPVIYMAGRDDPADVAGNLALYERAIPHLEAHVLENASHLIPVEHPETCARLLGEALGRAVPAAA